MTLLGSPVSCHRSHLNRRKRYRLLFWKVNLAPDHDNGVSTTHLRVGTRRASKRLLTSPLAGLSADRFGGLRTDVASIHGCLSRCRSWCAPVPHLSFF